MEWFLHQDTALQHWINTDLSNPLFDAVMPFLSGNKFFMPAAVLLGLLVLWRGRARGFLLVAVVGLAIAFGDGLVYPTIKELIGRVRPFEALPDVILRVGGTHSPGMPSSHAANWFCLVTIAFAFYRRSLRLTLLPALLVSFSRIYNGVHYPGDVLAGMLLGAGCGASVLWATNSIWVFAGRRWFPLWWEKWPSILYTPLPSSGEDSEEPEFRDRKSNAPAVARHVTIDMHWLRLGYLLIAITLLARLAFLAWGPMQLSPDEAYQWHWSKHLDISYFSKPPMIAYAQFVGTHIWGDSELGVRFLSPVIAAVLGLMLLRFIAKQANARAAFFLLLMLTTTPMLAAGAILMTVDPLSVLFWTAAMVAGWKAAQDKSTTADWAWVGLWMGLGFLSKYTGLFQLLSWAVFFTAWPGSRKQLKRPGPWIALLILAICSLPVLVWNSQHDWVTVSHVAEDAGAGKTWKFTLKYFFEFIGAEFGLLNPVYFIAAAWASIAFWKSARNNPRLVYLFSMGAPLFLVYLFFTFKSRALPNWIAPSVIPLFCLSVLYWDTRLRLGQGRVKTWLFAGLAIGGVAVLFGHNTDLIGKVLKLPVPAKSDPMRRVRAWPETAKLVDIVRQHVLEEGKPVFVIGDHYGITAELSFYNEEARKVAAASPIVFCRTSKNPRNQFHMWPGYTNRIGENAVFVRELSLNYKETYPAPPELIREFESVTEVGVRPVYIKRKKEPYRQIQIFICRGLKGQTG